MIENLSDPTCTANAPQHRATFHGPGGSQNDAHPARPDEVKPRDSHDPSIQQADGNKRHDHAAASSGEGSDEPNRQHPDDDSRCDLAPASSGEGRHDLSTDQPNDYEQRGCAPVSSGGSNPSDECDSSRTRQHEDDSTHGDT